MLHPSMRDLIKNKNQCKYSLVIAVAKKARMIAKQAEECGEKLDDKTVSLAIDEFAAGTCSFKEPDEII